MSTIPVLGLTSQKINLPFNNATILDEATKLMFGIIAIIFFVFFAKIAIINAEVPLLQTTAYFE